MSSNNLNLSAVRQRRLFGALKRSSKRRMQQRIVSATCAALLLALVLLLSGCHHQPIKPCETPQLPTRPALTLPPSSKSYSWNAAEIMKKWQETLTSGKATQ